MTGTSQKTAPLGMIAGTAICAVVSVFTNLYLIIPFYASFSGLTLDKILAICMNINPMLSGKWSLAFLDIIPFNLIKNGIVSLLTFLIYNKESRSRDSQSAAGRFSDIFLTAAVRSCLEGFLFHRSNFPMKKNEPTDAAVHPGTPTDEAYNKLIKKLLINGIVYKLIRIEKGYKMKFSKEYAYQIIIDFELILN